MGMPSTLSGIAGFIIFVIFVIGMSATDIFPDESQTIINSQNDFFGNMNTTLNSSAQPTNQGFFGSVLGLVGLDGIYTFITNILSTMVSFVFMLFSYFALFFGIVLVIPSEFYVLFVILGSTAIIAVIKLIMLRGE